MTTQEKISAIQTALGLEANGVFDGASADAAYARLVPVADPSPAAPEAAATPADETVPGGISADHWLEGAERDLLAGGSPMTVRRCVVIHFTSGATGRSSVDFWKTPEAKGASAHLVVDRDGTAIQCRPFDRTCGHAGVSRWRDPNSGQLYVGCNDFSIGIEIANAGDDEKLAARMSRLPPQEARHRNGGPLQKWEAYPAAQLDSVFRVVSLLMQRYKLDDITGHDCIAPERKNDPGPAFPMEELRKANGLSGLPAVHPKP